MKTSSRTYASRSARAVRQASVAKTAVRKILTAEKPVTQKKPKSSGRPKKNAPVQLTLVPASQEPQKPAATVVTDGGSERCVRCQGFVVQERYDDYQWTYAPVMMHRCINCGDIR